MHNADCTEMYVIRFLAVAVNWDHTLNDSFEPFFLTIDPTEWGMNEIEAESPAGDALCNRKVCELATAKWGDEWCAITALNSEVSGLYYWRR